MIFETYNIKLKIRSFNKIERNFLYNYICITLYKYIICNNLFVFYKLCNKLRMEYSKLYINFTNSNSYCTKYNNYLGLLIGKNNYNIYFKNYLIILKLIKYYNTIFTISKLLYIHNTSLKSLNTFFNNFMSNNSQLPSTSYSNFPRKLKKYTIQRSPHVHKKSREQFQLNFYSSSVKLPLIYTTVQSTKIVRLLNLVQAIKNKPSYELIIYIKNIIENESIK